MSAGPFNPRVLSVLAVAFCALFAASLLLTGADGSGEAGNPAGANTYSPSAVGHRGLFETLRNLDVAVVRAQSNPLPMLGEDGVLILAEPSVSLSSEENRAKVLGADVILLVLPKWSVRADRQRKDRIAEATLAPTFLAQAALAAVVNGGDVVRAAAPASYDKTIDVPDPVVEGQVQLIRNSKLKPIVSSKDGILLGQFTEGRRLVWVLADPDPIENHGIGKGGNAAFAAGMLENLMPEDGVTLVFDETIHGFASAPPNLLSFLYRFPFNLVALQFLASVALLLWAGMGRFGTPEAPVRTLGSGKRELIASAASLVDQAGHHAATLRRYIGVVLQEAGRTLRAPPQAAETELARWLDRTAQARGKPPAAQDTLARMDEAGPRDLDSQLATARAVHQWRKDLTHGLHPRLRDH